MIPISLTQADVRAKIATALEDSNIRDADIRVQSDGLGAWKIAIVASGFNGLSHEQREVASGLSEIPVSWSDLLTPSEAEWAGVLPADMDPAEAPLWAEALGKAGSEKDCPVFASDLDQDISGPAITTFYSLRGGVGRSTALVTCARILAGRGRKVVAVDMDLEAPGLPALFGVEIDHDQSIGVVDLLTDLDTGNGEIDLANHLIRVGSEDLFCLPAGRPTADYARKLSFLDPAAWYREERNPLRILIDRLCTGLPFKPDHILIDSRTGISPISGPLLFDVPHLAIIVFFPHPQAREGTGLLASALASARTSRFIEGIPLTPEPRFLASPVPGGESFEKYSRRAKEWVAEWLQPLNQKRPGKPPILDFDVTHVVPYREAFANTDQVSGLKRDWQDYEVVADWVDRLLPSETPASVLATVGSRKDRILSELQFPTGTAEQQPDLSETFVRGRKGTGKTALFRQLSEEGGNPAVKIVAPQSLQAGMAWSWSSDGYRAAEEVLKLENLNWQFFWSFFIASRLQFSAAASTLPPVSIADQISRQPRSEVDIIDALERVAKIPRRELLVGEWLRDLDTHSSKYTMLLFDGLDTGFGNTSQDRDRRKLATEGLFSFLIDRGNQFENLRLKIVLREDIWRQLQFNNKSHMFGRDASLSWRDSEDFYKVVLIHARRSVAFRELLSQDKGLSALGSGEPDSWTADAVTRAWILLIGERMKGSGTTYTKNWVWNRLADANTDRNPRYLLMLMSLVTAWEKGENGRSRYERSVIRPRALEQQLPEVSNWAVGAVREEFEELQPLLDKVANERTPFSADLLAGVSSEIVALAQEVGLLGVYQQERDGSPERYSVPEIYRLALGMKRRGQA
jgi:cellulose biosynthesis protein BcsQ